MPFATELYLGGHENQRLAIFLFCVMSATKLRAGEVVSYSNPTTHRLYHFISKTQQGPSERAAMMTEDGAARVGDRLPQARLADIARVRDEILGAPWQESVWGRLGVSDSGTCGVQGYELMTLVGLLG